MPLLLPVPASTITTADVLAQLRAHAVDIDTVKFASGTWPAQVDLTCQRGDSTVLVGVIALDCNVVGEVATAVAEVRLRIPDADEPESEDGARS
jgi:hypothetical protein